MKNKRFLTILLSVTATVVIGLSLMLAIFIKETKDDNANKNNSPTIESSTGAVTADASEKGGALYLTNGATFTLESGGFINFDQTYGGAIYVSSGCTFNMEGGIIRAGEAEYGGAIYIEAGGTANIYSGTIENCKAIKNATDTSVGGNGGAIYVEKGATLNIYGAVSSDVKTATSETGATIHFINNDAELNGGAIYLENGYNLKSFANVLIDSSDAVNGGAIYSPYCLTLDAEDGASTISNCSAENGGGICIINNYGWNQEGASVELNNIKFSSCSATNGGAVCLDGSSFIKYNNGLISDCSAENGGGIYHKSTRWWYENVDPDNPRDDYSEIKGVLFEDCSATTNGGAIYTSYYPEDIDEWAPCYIALNATFTNCSATTSGGAIYNAGDIQMYRSTVIADCIAKNGAGIYSTNKLSVYGGIIENCRAETDGRGGGLYINNGHLATISNLTIDNCFASTNAGAVFFPGGGGTTFTGCTITNNESNAGGAFYLSSGCTDLTLDNCDINYNISSTNGGAFATSNGANIKIKAVNTRINENRATDNGGGVYLLTGTLKLENSSVSGNTAKVSGGGVYVQSGNVEVNDSSVSKNIITGSSTNTGRGQGAGIFARNSTCTVTLLNDSIISENIIDSDNTLHCGAGIAAVSSATLDIKSATISNNVMVAGTASDGSTISNRGAGIYGSGATIILGERGAANNLVNIFNNNVVGENSSKYLGSKTISCEYGGGVLLYGKTLTINAATISGNKATCSAGVHCSGTSITMNEGQIIANYATDNSGGMTVMNKSSFNMNGGEILNNSANTIAAGLKVLDAETVVNLNGGKIKENYINPSEDYAQGAGMYVSNRSKVNILGTEISGNYIIHKSSLNRPFGGGVYVSENATINLIGGIIENNIACATVTNNVVSFYENNKNSVGGNVFVAEEGTFNMTGGIIAGLKDANGNYTNGLQSFFGGGIGNIGSTSLTGGTILNCSSKYGGAVGSYGGVKVDKETISNKVSSSVAGLVGDKKIDLRGNKLVIGSVTISNCSATLGSSIAAGYEIEFKGSPDIDGEISMSVLKDVYYNFNYIIGSMKVSLLEDDAKQYPEIYISGEFTPVKQLQLSFSQAEVEAKIEGGINAAYSMSNTSTMMKSEFVDTDKLFIVCANGVEVNPRDFLIYSDDGAVKYIVAKYSEKSIINSTFNKETLVFDETAHTGNALVLLTSYDLSTLLTFTPTEDRTAYTVGYGGYSDYYDPNETTQSFIKQVSSNNGLDLSLPSVHPTDGLPVIGVTANGFKGVNVKSIVMPEGYTFVGSGAFVDCENLVNVSLPVSLVTLEDNAFYNCASLSAINLDKVVTIGANAFEKSGLSGEVVLTSLENVGIEAFVDLTISGEINLAKITTIGEKAFSGCSNIVSLTLGENLKTLGNYAFYNTTGLTTINFNAKKMNDLKDNNYVFYQSGQNGDGIIVNFGDIVETVPAYLFRADSSSTTNKPNIIAANFSDNSNCEKIGASAFFHLDKITEINIPSGVLEIGGSAFDSCKGLTVITIPEKTTIVGNYAFQACTGLTELNIDAISLNDFTAYKNNFKNIGSSSNLVKVTFGENVTRIPDYLFDLHTSASASSGTSYIGEVLFKGDKVTYIGQDAFYHSEKMTGALELTNIQTISAGAFNGCSLLSGTINLSNVEIIGEYAFNNCSSLQGITDGSLAKVTNISKYALNGCSLLSGTINLTNATTVGEYAFNNCSSLTSITDDSLAKATSIGTYAFYGCSNLKGYVDLSKVETLGNYSFTNCSNLLGWINLTSLSGYVPTNAFEKCSSFSGVTFGSGVTGISNSAFNNCDGFTELIIGVNVTYINRHAFGGCNNIRKINFPEGKLTLIDGFAFNGNTSLKEVTIPDSVKKYGPNIFMNCTSLQTATIGSGLSSFGTRLDSNGAATTDQMKMVTGDHMFTGCNNLTTLKLSEGIKTIGQYAFVGFDFGSSKIVDGCKNVESLSVPSSVTTLKNCAFYGLDNANIVIERSACPLNSCNSSCSHMLKFGINLIKVCKSLEIKAESAGAESGQTQKVVITANAFNGVSVETIRLLNVYETKGYAFANSNVKELVIEGSNTSYIRDYAFADCASIEKIYFDCYYLAPCYKEGVYMDTHWWSGRDTYDNMTFNNSNNEQIKVTYSGTTYEVCDFSSYNDIFNIWSDYIYPSKVFECSSGNYQSSAIDLTIGKNVTKTPTLFFSNMNIQHLTLSSPSLSSYGGISPFSFYNLCELYKNGIYIEKGWNNLYVKNYFVYYGNNSGITLPTVYVDYAEGSLPTAWGDYFLRYNVGLEDTLPIECLGGTLTEIFKFELNSDGKYTVSAASTGISGEITIPDQFNGKDVTKIKANGFSNCGKITKVVIGANIKEIGDFAFTGCSGLTSLSIGENCDSIGKGITSSCTSLISIDVKSSNTVYKSTNNDILTNAILTIDGTKLVAGCTESVVASTVTTINPYAFYSITEAFANSLSLTNVKTVGEYAFYNCQNLTLSSGDLSKLTSIGSYAFYNCQKLTGTLKVNCNAESWAFARCIGITGLFIGASVSEINTATYGYMSGLESIVVSKDNSTFVKTESGCFYQGLNAIVRYDQDRKWFEYLTDVYPKTLVLGCKNTYLLLVNEERSALTINWGITDIASYAFSGCTGLTNFEISATVNTIGAYAFAECTNLTTVTLANNVFNNYLETGLSYIGSYAFANCTKLGEITVYNYTGFGYNVFDNTTNVSIIKK